MELVRSRLALKYLLFEMIPSFLMGVFIFVLILLMFQALRLTEFVLVHGVSLKMASEIMLYLSVSFLPVIDLLKSPFGLYHHFSSRQRCRARIAVHSFLRQHFR